MIPGELTTEQVLYFETFGFLILRSLFSADEIAVVTAEAQRLWQEDLGRRPTAEEFAHLGEIVEQSALLTGHVEGDRIYQPARQLTGDNPIWSGSECNHGVQTGTLVHTWHADRVGAQELDYRRIKMMLYLVPMRAENGALRVIPGSHRAPLHTELEEASLQHRDHADHEQRYFGVMGQDVPSYLIETEPGDLLIFNHSLFHAVYSENGKRSYLAFKFAARPTCDAHLLSLQRWSKYLFEPHENWVNSSSAKLRDMVDGLEDLGRRARELAAGQA